MKTYPKAFSHIGITVPNLEKALKFYTEVMGWYVVMKPSIIREDPSTPIGAMCIDVFGKGFSEFRIAHLSTSDSIGIELFEFSKADKGNYKFSPFKTGIFHYCIKDPNIEDLVEKIKRYGGKQRMPIREFYPGSKPYKMVYMEDPFGNIVEIYTHSYELHFSSGTYD